jgi:hypothetical protein
MKTVNYLLTLLAVVLVGPPIMLNSVHAQEISNSPTMSNATNMQGIPCPAITSNVTRMPGMLTPQPRLNMSAEEYFNRLMEMENRVETRIITNQSVNFDPDMESVTIGNQTFRITGDVTTTSSCISDYIVTYHDDGTISCGVHDECAGQSYSIPCA